jgi:hypothetical protein
MHEPGAWRRRHPEGASGPERWHSYPVAAGAAQTGDLDWTAGEAVIAGPAKSPAEQQGHTWSTTAVTPVSRAQ